VGRNPLRTGLGSARRDGLRPGAHAHADLASQSPENGSRLCKGSRARPCGGSPRDWSQSPENGSRLCKIVTAVKLTQQVIDVAIP